MKKKSFLQNFHTLPALCRTFGAGECEKAENWWKWGGGSDGDGGIEDDPLG